MVMGTMDINTDPGFGGAMDSDMVCSVSSSLAQTSLWTQVAAQASKIGMPPVGAHPLDVSMVRGGSPASLVFAGPLVITGATGLSQGCRSELDSDMTPGSSPGADGHHHGPGWQADHPCQLLPHCPRSASLLST